MRSCWKLSACPAEPDGSEDGHAAVQNWANEAGNTYVITYLRTKSEQSHNFYF